MRLKVAYLLLLLPFVGCAGVEVKEPDRENLAQTADAAEQMMSLFRARVAELEAIFGKMQVVFLFQAAGDIKSNSETTLSAWKDEEHPTGAPLNSKKLVYSPEESKESRERTIPAHEEKSVWQWIVAGLVGGSGLFAVGLRLLPGIFGGPLGSVVESLITGIAKARQSADAAPNDTIHVADLLKHVAEAQTPAVKNIVRTWSARVEKKMGFSPDVKLKVG